MPFTVKSGGHVPFPSSNIDSGIVIDLVNLDTLQLSEDKSVVSVGPGNRWKNVAAYLEPEGLAVVGGRVGEVGVSGLTLGGGISWFSGKYGWACDNVRTYEVVLADGSVVEASVEENADLYKALRGGGGPNFGIVTRFDFETFKQVCPRRGGSRLQLSCGVANLKTRATCGTRRLCMLLRLPTTLSRSLPTSLSREWTKTSLPTP